MEGARPEGAILLISRRDIFTNEKGMPREAKQPQLQPAWDDWYISRSIIIVCAISVSSSTPIHPRNPQGGTNHRFNQGPFGIWSSPTRKRRHYCRWVFRPQRRRSRPRDRNYMHPHQRDQK
jgi:hypothetical protein